MGGNLPKVFFITGASAGFGAAFVRRFAAKGARVIASARRAEKLEALAREYGRERTLPLTLDVQDQSAVARAVESLPRDFAEVDVLVNNAGLGLGLDPAQRADIRDWDTMIDTNVKGLVYLTHALLPGMVARGRGHVVNIGSVAGTYPYPGGNIYGATKAFVHQFSLNLRSDLHGTGVRVTCIEPGLVEGTEFSDVRFKGDRERAAAVYKGANALTPEDVADAVEWVVSLDPRVNINTIEMMPATQSFAGFQIHRKS
ncbi:MAG: SDR family oxidoreductase [Alphaproteobacteria bacterium]